MRSIDPRDKCATKRLVLNRVDLANGSGGSANSDRASAGSQRSNHRRAAVTSPTDHQLSLAQLALTVSPALNHMLDCIQTVRTVRVAKGKHVVIAGDTVRCFYANRDGWLFRYKILHNGNRQIVDFVLPGEVFALQACLFKTSLYSIITVTPASLSAVPLEMIDEFFVQNPRLSRAIFWSVVREAARNVEHLTDAGRRSAYERLSHLLLELFVRLRMAGLTEWDVISFASYTGPACRCARPDRHSCQPDAANTARGQFSES